MSKVIDSTVLPDSTDYSRGIPLFNLQRGAQFGWFPKYGAIGEDGEHYEEWINNQAYVKRSVIPILLDYPKFFDFMPKKESWLLAYKSLMESQAQKIEGLKSNLIVTTEQHAVGAYEMQDEITNVSRERSEPVYTWQDRANKSITRFLEAVIIWGYMDPETKAARCRKYMEPTDYGFIFTPDFQAGAMLYIEPDVISKQCIDAWMCFNMLFKGAGNSRTGYRDLTQPSEIPTVEVELSAITLSTINVLQFGTKTLNELDILGLIPDEDLVLPYNKINPNVVSAPGGFNKL